MAFKLNGKPLAVDVPFTVGDVNYPANWLRLSTADEKTALGITEVADSRTYDSRFYSGDGTAKALDDVDAKDNDGNLIKNSDGSQMVIQGVKSVLKAQEKGIDPHKLQQKWAILSPTLLRMVSEYEPKEQKPKGD